MAESIDTAPLSTHDKYEHVLLWVRGRRPDGKRGAWVPGVVYEHSDGRRSPQAQGIRGTHVDIPYWAPFPPDPE